MHFKGTAHRYGRDIDTDVIIPARYLNSSEPEWLAQHCLEDMRQAAAVLKGRKVHPDVRCIVIPATQQVYKQCIAEGLMDIFLDANCAVSTPTCGPCLGGYMGILAAGERSISTSNRNFVGRMGDPTSEVYLSSPAVAAASAVLGHIGLPEDLD